MLEGEGKGGRGRRIKNTFFCFQRKKKPPGVRHEENHGRKKKGIGTKVKSILGLTGVGEGTST